jgi:peptidoglycan hydrolase-like protein with peptidoglycan-binding domain
VHSFRSFVAIVICAGVFASPAFGTRTHRSSTAGSRVRHHSSRRLSSARSTSHRLHGQQSIASDRVTQIQQALIREHYLTGEPTGNWDDSTKAAMQKYQGDQGWQTKLMPDSRALKKLGLGPDYSNALNAKNSTFAAPAASSTIPTDQAAGFATASGVSQ